MDHKKIIAVAKHDSLYPPRLIQIPDPPGTLYIRGKSELLHSPAIGVVGTRKPTSYGKEVTNYIVQHLVNYGFTITSGLALGIDALAHQAALENGGKTIAVLGSGIDDESIYPRANHALAKKVLSSGGLLASEYTNGTHATPYSFPARNRIVSGLCLGVVIIEADEQSGTLITARHALEQNRDVFAVPGSIFSPVSTGTHTLIQKGAKLVRSPEDIVEEYSEIIREEQKKRNEGTPPDPVHQKILGILQGRGPVLADIVIRESRIAAPEIMAALSVLELRGRITLLSDGKYQLKQRP